jgi:hypothetical protein
MLDIGGEQGGSLVLVNGLRAQKKSDSGKTPKILQVLFQRDVNEADPPELHIKLTGRSCLKQQCTHMGFNNIDLTNIHNDLVEHPELVVFCALTNERPAFMQARTTGYLLGLPATLFLSTVLRALRELMYGGGDSPLPGLRAMSQNILWSTTKVNKACARPPYVM